MVRRLAVFGVGYVLGARAGRERYDTIRVTATKLAARLEDYARGSDKRPSGGSRGSAPRTTH
jgi:hypothetical protein